MASPGSAGSGDTRVDRPEEGLPGLATRKTLGWPDNQNANPPTRASFDAGLATGLGVVRAKGQIETWDVNELPSRSSERTP